MNSPATDENKANEENKKDKRAKAQVRIQELYNNLSSFIKEDLTGFVWLYLQK